MSYLKLEFKFQIRHYCKLEACVCGRDSWLMGILESYTCASSLWFLYIYWRFFLGWRCFIPFLLE